MTPSWMQRYAPTWSPNPNERQIKSLIWLYILLWFAEGALRKWIMPSLADPLLIIRDPVAILIIWRALNSGWQPERWVTVLVGIGGISFAVSLVLVGPLTALFGLRTVCLHFPLVFIFARVLNREDVYRIGTIFLDLALPMAVLMMLQFSAGADAFISKGVGAELGGQLDGGGGRIRPPGLFSFTLSAVHYVTLTLAFLLHRYLAEDRRSNLQLVVPALGVALAIVVSISRTLVFSAIIVGLFCMVGAVRAGVPLRKLAGVALTAAVVGGFLAFTSIAREGMDAFNERWQDAGDTRTSFLERGVNTFKIGTDVLSDAGLLGKGLGLGTNVGAQLATGAREFLLAEDEWSRIVLEMGVVLGLVFIAWRVLLTVQIGILAVRAWARRDVLPSLLFSAASVSLLAAQTGVPAILGFVAIAGGLTLASLKRQTSSGAPRLPPAAPHWRRWQPARQLPGGHRRA